MSNGYPWFRLYNEILNDRKITRICRVTGCCKATVIGVWTILLSFASESPERGHLLIAEDMWLTFDEIRAETGLDENTFDAIMSQLKALNMIELGEGISIRNWTKRQPNSDSSTERVRRHRAKKRAQQAKRNGETPLQGNVTETLQKQSGNVIDLDLDKEREGEREGEREPPTPAPKARNPEAINIFCDETGIDFSTWTGKKGREKALLFLETIDTTIGTKSQDLDLWRETIKKWRLSGYRNDNLQGMIDWYNKGQNLSSQSAPAKTVPKQPTVLHQDLNETPTWLVPEPIEASP